MLSLIDKLTLVWVNLSDYFIPLLVDLFPGRDSLDMLKVPLLRWQRRATHRVRDMVYARFLVAPATSGPS